MPLVITAYRGEKLPDREKKLPKISSWSRVVEQHENALIQRQEEIRRDVPIADEKTLNLVFNE